MFISGNDILIAQMGRQRSGDCWNRTDESRENTFEEMMWSSNGREIRTCWKLRTLWKLWGRHHIIVDVMDRRRCCCVIQRQFSFWSSKEVEVPAKDAFVDQRGALG